MPPESVKEGAPPRAFYLLAGVIGLTTLALYARPLLFPVLLQDDFQVLERSWTWGRTVAGLWVPQNEHAMPPGRVLTWLLVCLAGSAERVPAVVSWVGPLGILLAQALLYLFVRRETGREFDGLLAAALFGITSVYQQAVWWFAASFSVLALDTFLLALLACQRWRQTGRALYLDGGLLLCALAPAWFASGILAGPLCCLYLLGRQRGEELVPRTFSLAPLVGSGLFLAVSLPRTAAHILHLEHYGGKSALDSFHPLTGAVFTARSIVDNLALGVLGIRGLELPLAVSLLVLAGLVVAGAWWARRGNARLFLLGAGLIGASYLLTYSARAEWGYAGMAGTGWSRYHLLPHLGLVLFVLGGLPERLPDRLDGPTLTPTQGRVLQAVIAVTFLIQLPRGLLGVPSSDPAQRQTLRRIDRVEARCQELHISAEQARAALPKLDLSRWSSEVNGWDLLRGSATPEPLPPEEVRRVLEE